MSVRTLLGTLLLSVGAVASLGTAAHAAVFAFPATGTSTSFSVTSGGQTATFSSPSGPGTFAVTPTTGLFSFPVGLVDQSFFPGDVLQISFSTPVVGAISIPFAITDSGITTDFLSVSVNGGTATKIAATPDSLPLGEPEGRVSLVSATGVSTLTLSALDSTGALLGFGIGNVSVPEPISLSLIGAGLLGFAVSRRRAA